MACDGLVRGARIMSKESLPRGRALRLGAALSFVSCSAFGSGFALLEQSASRLGSAFSGTAAAADDATTIFFNPAGLARLERSEVMVVASGVSLKSEFHNVNSRPALGQPLGNEGGDAGDWNFVPSGYLALPLNDTLAFGLGVNVPFGLKLEYDSGWIGRFQALNSEIETYNFNPALSLRLNEHFTIGFGLDYQKVQAELTNSVNYTAAVAQGLQQLVAAGQLPPAAVPGLIAANAGLEGGAAVRGDDTAWGYNVGVLFEFSPETRLGLSYRSAVSYEVEGSVGFSPPSATNQVGAAIIAAASSPGAALSDGAVSVDLKLPAIAFASFYHRVGRMELLADVAWTGWSSVQELRIVRDSGAVLSVTPERWQDTWRYALGATFAVNDSWKLRAGAGYDETPVPDDTRTPRLPDPERTWAAIGAQWRPSEALTLDIGYAHLFSDDVDLNQDAGSAVANGLLNGKQESAVDIVGAQFGYRF
jgi:long-chain fatty acid transport protein